MHDVDQFEDALVERFRRHPVLAQVAGLAEADFAELLLQRRFLSLAFTPVYDLAIDLLQDEQGRRIARVILREEYPGRSGGVPSHREDMTEDLRRLGIGNERIAASRPTAATLHAVNETFALVADAGGRPDSDLRILTVLRFWGEVLVSVEYTRLWERMARRLTVEGENRSVFYHPHLLHDAKTAPLAGLAAEPGTHADALAARVAALLVDERSTAVFAELEERAYRIKAEFYDQFRPALDRAGLSDLAGSRPQG
ncbi:hypothetical protein ACFY00_25885 [Kitasatospora sp. NPDC001540]|uniref:hypothetical protein n=1 Tax=Kitasatospora sp. NPDC001540 TaxID=3364014 RepID=UPI0036A7B00C